MSEWWRDPETEICQFFVPVSSGESHVLTLHARQIDREQWEYVILQWWYKSPTLWLSWIADQLLESSPDLNVQLAVD